MAISLGQEVSFLGESQKAVEEKPILARKKHPVSGLQVV
jgi:hypothetical protein